MNPSVAAVLSDLKASRYEPRIRDELIAAIFARLPTIVLSEAILTTVVIVAVLWEVATLAQLSVWLAVHAAIVFFHGYALWSFRARPSETLALRRLLVGCMLLVGIYWACLLAYLFSVIPIYIYQLYLFLYVGAMGVLAVALLSEVLMAVVSFAVPQMVALSAMAVCAAEWRYVVLGALGTLSVISLVLFARTKNQGQVDALAMRFAILDLAHELGEQRDAATRANVAKSTFLAAASHDLRQPLHALTLLTAALQASEINANTRSISEDINAAVGSLEKMFAALLDISRLDAGVLRVEPRHFQLGEFLRRIVNESLPQAQAKGLRLTCDDCALTAHTDPILLERILRNYLTNALRYTDAGEIRVTCELITEGIRIAVSDTGIGIASEQHADIFDEFYQVNNPERDRTKGLGLGLAIVRRLGDLLKHPIGLESTPNRGSSFFVVVPAGDPSQIPSDATKSSQTLRTFETDQLRGLRVLVIDDDVAVRDSMRTLLTAWHCQVAIAGDADQSVRIARDTFGCPDALVVDYRLRKQRTGIEAINQVRREFSTTIPALIVSGDTAPDRLREVAESGHTMVHKPVQPAALRAFLLSTKRLSQNVSGGVTTKTAK